jgi:hypothetical protein
MTTETTKAAGGSHDEKFVKFSADKLTSLNAKGEEHTYTVSKEVKLTRDGKEAKLTDLKSGDTIRITASKDDKTKLLAVDCGKHIPSLGQSKASTTGK